MISLTCALLNFLLGVVLGVLVAFDIITFKGAVWAIVGVVAIAILVVLAASTVVTPKDMDGY